jgi:HK97 family phage major capsid protein
MALNIDIVKASVDAMAISTTTALKLNSDRMDRVEAVLRRPGFSANTNDNDSAIRAERDAVAVYCRHGDDTKLKQLQAGMSTGSDPDGGYFSMPTYSSSMTKLLFDISPIRRLARVENITSGDSFVEPVDNGQAQGIWVGEQSARPATNSPQLGLLTVDAHEIYSNTPVTQRLIDDAGFDLGAYIESKSVDQFARSEGVSFVTGNGVSQPRGFLTHNTVATSDATRAWTDLQYVPSGGATTITADALRDISWTLRAPYRQGASWLMNSSTANSIDKLKDLNGDYLWRSSSSAGMPPTLLGYPVSFDENMPDVAASSLSIAFANWTLAYLVVDRLGVRFLRDPFSSKPNVLFYAYKRVGGNVANTQALKLLKTGVS